MCNFFVCTKHMESELFESSNDIVSVELCSFGLWLQWFIAKIMNSVLRSNIIIAQNRFEVEIRVYLLLNREFVIFWAENLVKKAENLVKKQLKDL